MNWTRIAALLCVAALCAVFAASAQAVKYAPSGTRTRRARARGPSTNRTASGPCTRTADTNWVTYTIGGNDAGFSSVITACAQPSWASNCDGAINTAQSYIANTLPGRLDLEDAAESDGGPAADRDQRRGDAGGGELRLPRRDPGLRRSRGLRRGRRLLDGVDQRPLQPGWRKLPPEGERSREWLLPGGESRNGLIFTPEKRCRALVRHR
jgi:hypothetical protein